MENVIPNSQESVLSEASFSTLLDSLRDITEQGRYTKVLELEPEVTYVGHGTENLIDFECEEYSLCPQFDTENVFNDLVNLPRSTLNQEDLLQIGAEQLQSNQVENNNAITQESVQATAIFELPATNNWPGHFDFHLSFDTSQEKKTKGSAWTYSESLDKLFVNMASACPIRFHTSSLPPAGSYIRITPLFVKPSHANDIVQRCLHHSLPSDPTNLDFKFPDHLIRIESSKAMYETNPITNRKSVSIPFDRPEDGIDYIPYIMKFMCLSSCAGNLCRRPLQVIFNLENGGQCVGRKSILVKVCACPGRDRKNEEKPKEEETKNKKLGMVRTTSQEFYSLVPASKKQRVEVDEEVFTLKVKTKKRYEMLRQINMSLEMTDRLQSRKAIASESRTESKIKKLMDEPKLKKVISFPSANDVKSEKNDSSSILSWLSEINMEAYYDLFLGEGILELYHLTDVTKEKLIDMGIGEAHRQVIYAAIQRQISPASNYKSVDLSQNSQHSFFTSQGSSRNVSHYTLTRCKITHHTSLDHDYC